MCCTLVLVLVILWSGGIIMKKTVLITGATSGMGLLTANLFDKKGWQVVATGRNRQKLNEWQRSHANQLAIAMDVTDATSVKQAVEKTLSDFRRIDVVVNCAGYGLLGSLEGCPLADIDRQLQVNLYGVINVIQAVLPAMRRQKSGTIVNVTSVGARTTAPFMSSYSASKFAVEGLSESIFYELLEHNIRVKIVEPGHFKTNFFDNATEDVHLAYRQTYDTHMTWVRADAAKAPIADKAAETIYKAAADNSRKLRYPVRGHMLLISRCLPWSLWSHLAGSSMKRPHKGA